MSGLSLMDLAKLNTTVGSRYALNMPYFIAHRGGAFAPENTRPAFELAAAFRARMVEFDVQLSLDNELVLIHDEDIERTTLGWSEWPAEKSKKVKDLNLAELKDLDAGFWLEKRFAGTRIPSLKEFIDLCLDLNLLMNLEIKTSDLNPETGLTQDPEQDIKITEALIAWLKKTREETPEIVEQVFSRLLISSFSPKALYLVRAAFPEVNLAYLAEIKDWDTEWVLRKEKIKEDMSVLGCVSLNLNQDVFALDQKETRLAEIKEVAGSALLLAYTVNDPARAEELRTEFGLSGVFTDQLIQEAFLM